VYFGGFAVLIRLTESGIPEKYSVGWSGIIVAGPSAHATLFILPMALPIEQAPASVLVGALESVAEGAVVGAGLDMAEVIAEEISVVLEIGPSVLDGSALESWPVVDGASLVGAGFDVAEDRAEEISVALDTGVFEDIGEFVDAGTFDDTEEAFSKLQRLKVLV